MNGNGNSSAQDSALRCEVREKASRLRCSKSAAKRFLHGLTPVTGTRRLNCYKNTGKSSKNS